MRSNIVALVIAAVFMGCGREPVNLVLTVPGDEMKYDTDVLRVPENSRVKLTLVNKATLSTMRHNVLIYDFKGSTYEKALNFVGELAAKAGEASQYVPQVPGIITSSNLADPGQTLTIEFDAPPPGEYLFLCTFQPAHYKTMNGRFIVEKK